MTKPVNDNKIDDTTEQNDYDNEMMVLPRINHYPNNSLVIPQCRGACNFF
jgi:hypothetical protein